MGARRDPIEAREQPRLVKGRHGRIRPVAASGELRHPHSPGQLVESRVPDRAVDRVRGLVGGADGHGLELGARAGIKALTTPLELAEPSDQQHRLDDARGVEALVRTVTQ